MPAPHTPRGIQQGQARALARGAKGMGGGKYAGTSPVSRTVRQPSNGPALSPWSFRAGVNVDGELASTTIAPGDSDSVPYSGFTTHGSPVGAAEGVGGIDVTGSGLFLLFLSVTATGGGGTGYVRLTVANHVLSQAAIGSAAVFQGWFPFPVDAGFGAEFVGEPFVENAAGADVTVTGDVYVYPAIAG